MAFSKLSGDEQRTILAQLRNALDPRLVVYFSSASKELRALLPPAVQQQLRADYEEAAALLLTGSKVGTTSGQLKIINGQQIAPGKIWGWTTGGLMHPMGGLNTHIATLKNKSYIYVVPTQQKRVTDQCEEATQSPRNPLKHCPHTASSSQCLLHELCM